MKKVGEITHERSGIIGMIYLDKLKFRCEVHGVKFEAEDATTLRTKVLDYLEHWMQLDWHPVICVELSDGDGWQNKRKTGLWVATTRMYLSRSPAGDYMKVDWEVAPDHRKALCGRAHASSVFQRVTLPFRVPFRESPQLVWMDYTEAKWNSLQALQRGIVDLVDKLNDLISTEQGNELLESKAQHIALLRQTNVTS